MARSRGCAGSPAYVDSCAGELLQQHGQIADAKVLLLTSLLIARRAVGRLRGDQAPQGAGRRPGPPGRGARRPRRWTVWPRGWSSLPPRWRVPSLPMAVAAGFVARRNHRPGPSSFQRELSLTWPWSRHMAPTCVAGPRDDHDETALAATAIPSSDRCMIDRSRRWPRRTQACASARVARGAGIAIDASARASRAAAAWHALAALPWRVRPPSVALFWPLADEIDTLPLLACAALAGCRAAPAADAGPRQAAGVSSLDAGARACRRTVPGARAHRRTCRPIAAGDRPRTAARLRRAWCPAGLWRRLLRHDLRRHRRCGRRRRFVAGYCFAGQEVDAGSGGRHRRTARSRGHRGRLPSARAEAERMRLLFVGDVVGRSGRAVLLAELPKLRARRSRSTRSSSTPRTPPAATG